MGYLDFKMNKKFKEKNIKGKTKRKEPKKGPTDESIRRSRDFINFLKSHAKEYPFLLLSEKKPHQKHINGEPNAMENKWNPYYIPLYYPKNHGYKQVIVYILPLLYDYGKGFDIHLDANDDDGILVKEKNGDDWNKAVEFYKDAYNKC
jgi:hypothetical protein